MSMPEREAFRMRMEEAAQRVIEGPMRRRRWSAVDRDRVADVLEDVVRIEDEVRRGVRGRTGERLGPDNG